LTRLAPLESLHIVDPSVDGSSGTNRAHTANLQIEAHNDLQAVRCFLAEYQDSPGTLRVYTKECERLLLWALLERGKPLSSLNRQDFETYLDFLNDPQPAERWCGPRCKRHSADWRPFVGPLSEAAKLGVLAALNSMMIYLVDAGYLAGNPLGLIRRRRKRAVQLAEFKIERFLDEEMWAALNEVIEDLPKDSSAERNAYERARFIAALLIMLAPRVGELESHPMSSFREVRGRWWWYVLGKGQKPARVPVPDDMLAALMRYRAHLGLPPLPGPEDETPLLLSLKGNRPITARRLNQVLKELFVATAVRLEAHAPHKAAKLRKASAHWGRHTSITAKVDSGIDRRYVQKDARHEDPRTTSLYIHEDDERWHDEAQKHRLRWNEKRNAQKSS
jgi:integrase